VLLLDFDSLPSKRSEAIPILRFRLRRLVSFDADEANLSYQVLSQTAEQVRVLVLATPRTVLAEYEDAVRDAGFHAGVVLPSTLAASTLLGPEASLVVNRSGDTLTTAILRGDELLLHRALDFENEGEPQTEGRTLTSGTSASPASALSVEALRAEDIRQTVSVALAYYEDTLASSPSELFYIGPGTAADFEQLLGETLLAAREPSESSLRVRELLPSLQAGGLGAPRTLVAPVAGALRNS
jgi:type IV pilus assembly protein PilM